MSTPIQDLLLSIGGAGFVVVLLLKLLDAAGERKASLSPELRARLADAKRRARDRGASAAQRSAALRELSQIALEDMRRPSRAASYARRAERLDPRDPASAGLLALALRRAARYRALERLLWRQLATHEAGGEAYRRAFAELVGLYEGPLHRPETASALRRLDPNPA